MHLVCSHHVHSWPPDKCQVYLTWPLRKPYLVEYVLRGPERNTQRIFALVVEVLGFLHDGFYALRPICGFVQTHFVVARDWS